MLIKPVDDKSRRIAFLLNLYDSPMLNAEQKTWLDNELWTLRRNFLGEETSANFIDSCFAESEDYAVLHDLRLHLRDGAVRMDHLLLARTCAFIVETGLFEGDVSIDEHGDFTIEYSSGDTQTVATPLKRGQRQEKHLQEFFSAMDIKVRGEPLPVHHLMVFPKTSAIRRPPESKLDTSNVIKSNALKVFIEEMSASQPTGGMLKGFSFARMSREKDSLSAWAEKIVSHHHPDNPFYLPKFIRPPKRHKTADAEEAAADSLPPAEDMPQQAPLADGSEAPPSLVPDEIAAALQPEAAPSEQPSSAATPEETTPNSAHSTEACAPGEEAAPAPTSSTSEEKSEASHEGAVASVGHDDTPTEFLEPHHDDADAPTEFLEPHLDDADALTEFLEPHHDDADAPTEFLELHHDDADAPTEFLEPAPAAPQPAATPAISTCALCGRPLMPGMVKFCLAHPKRFDGKLYCFTHQDNFPPVPEEGA